MIKCILGTAFAVLALNASAEVFKCKDSDGKLKFSDTPCRAGSISEIIPDRSPVTQQQRQEAQQRAMQMQSEAGGLESNKQADNRVSRQHKDSESGNAPFATRTSDPDAYSNCIRDVERHGASQNIKAELIAACRTAGTAQSSKQTTTDTVEECVRSVERTGASEADKARQLAICHGGDVRPLFLPVPVPRAGSH